MMESSAWDTLVGHTWAAALLDAEIRNGRVGHAYLITGPEQIGKTTLARLFAQALNCEHADRESQPCGRCRACKLIAADRHPDLRILEPAISDRGKRTLKIDEIRALQQDLSLAAYEARWRVVIIPHFDAATTGAANAFLKTLEEPPRHVVLLLTATEADALLPTITSRCRVLSLRPLTVAQIAEALKHRWHVAPDEAVRLAHLADGRLGWAVEATKNPDLLQTRQDHLVSLDDILAGRRVQRFAVAEQLARNPEALPGFLHTWVSWWRDLVLTAWGAGNGSVVNVDRHEQLQQLAQQWGWKTVESALKQTQDASWQLDHNANARLVLENLFLSYPYPDAEMRQPFD